MNDDVILLVEDNGDDVVLVRRAFRRAGVATRLEVVGDGDAALEYLQGIGTYADRDAWPLPKLMLLDLKLPRRSGLEVLQWLQDRPELQPTAVVVLTSSRENTDLRRAYALGANSYLVKPVEFDDLLRMVQTLNLYWIRMNQMPRPGGA